MNKQFYPAIVIFFILLFASDLYSQTFKITGEVRPRYEYRHGFKTLFPDDATAANFISQRTRLNGYFANEIFKAYVSFQDVRVWGDVNQLNKGDVYGLSVHEAWAQIKFAKVFHLKVGRQEIIYDDHRIFGSVAWAQQARSHDAAVFKFFFGDNNKLDLGFAYNAMQESLYEVAYTNKNYKTIQWIHYHGQFGKSGISVLFLNNGVAYDADDGEAYEEKIAFSQTIGARYSFKGEKIKFNVALYDQLGKNGKNHDLSAFYAAADISFHLVKVFSFGIGAEYLSGTSTNDRQIQDYKDKSFTPFYGTNHKFNGWMDYFYVGNYNGQNGLIDIYIPLLFKIKKWAFGGRYHYFMAAATVSGTDNDTGLTKDYGSGLGIEVDYFVKYTFSKAVSIQGGYSHMFATETMQVIKYPDNPSGNFYKNTNNWGWIMLTFKPTFFNSDNKKK